MGAQGFVFDLGMLSDSQMQEFTDWSIQVRMPDRVTCSSCHGKGSYESGDPQDGDYNRNTPCRWCKETGQEKNREKVLSSDTPLVLSLGDGRRVRFTWNPKAGRIRQEILTCAEPLYRCCTLTDDGELLPYIEKGALVGSGGSGRQGDVRVTLRNVAGAPEHLGQVHLYRPGEKQFEFSVPATTIPAEYKKDVLLVVRGPCMTWNAEWETIRQEPTGGCFPRCGEVNFSPDYMFPWSRQYAHGYRSPLPYERIRGNPVMGSTDELGLVLAQEYRNKGFWVICGHPASPDAGLVFHKAFLIRFDEKSEELVVEEVSQKTVTPPETRYFSKLELDIGWP
ncbi:MAG: hypothetical protein PHR51_02780 [Patescibacteria group bacterium]|nr:hypothetical protein [Patescibacteria group bacterium]